MNLEDLVTRAQAAEMLGMSRKGDPWRAVRKHAGQWPAPPVTLVAIGTTKAAPRSEMAAFAAWYKSNVARKPQAAAPSMAQRRATLRANIAAILERG